MTIRPIGSPIFLAQTAAEVDSEVFVAEQDGRVIGLMSLIYFYYFPLTRKTCRMTALVVDRAERSTGVGTQLVDQALDRARETDCLGLEVTTSLTRTRTQAYYGKLGFAKTSYRYYKTFD